MKAAFIINARDKAPYVARAVRSALAQTYPCHIILSDQNSTDGTYDVMDKTLADAGVPEIEASVLRGDGSGLADVKTIPRHRVDLLRCSISGKYGMEAANAHTLWLAEQTDADWIFQCSADDYSLPGRVSTCMRALERLRAEKKECSAIACTMFFAQPGEEVGPMTPSSGYPLEDGYVSPGVGIWKMAYGSTIQGWAREFLLKVGSAGRVTGDVYHGFLAATDKGYYVVRNPQHVHVQHASLDNMGFQGKMRAAEAGGDKETIHRINELNRFQLFELYLRIKIRQQEIYPLAHAEDQNALLQMMIEQAAGWYQERAKLHEEGITPGIL